MGKENMMYMFNGIVFRHKKEGNIAICNNCIYFEGSMLREVSEKDKYYVIILKRGILRS